MNNLDKQYTALLQDILDNGLENKNYNKQYNKMNKTEKLLNVNVDIKASTPITSPEGNHVFTEGVILRKISKFVAGTTEDAVIPIPCFYDVKTGKVLVELLPKDIRDEYANI